MTQGNKNLLGRADEIFWDIGKMFILFFTTLAQLFINPVRVIQWAIRKDKDKSVDFCPPVIFFLLSIGLLIALSHFIFLNQSFDLNKSSAIFINFLTKSPNLNQGIVFLCGLSIFFTISAVLLLIFSGRIPTKEKISNTARFLIYYWSCILFFLLVVFVLSLLLGLDDPISETPVGIDILFICAITINFSRALKIITKRKWWLSSIAILITQLILPITVLSLSGELDHSYKWTMERKYNESDFVGVVKIGGIDIFEESKSLSKEQKHTLNGIALGIVEEVWKGESRLLKIGLPVAWRGREFNVEKDKRYLVFFEIYKDTYIPIDGSPVGFYEIQENEQETLIPLGHKDFITERKLIKEESIPLKTAKDQLMNKTPK